MREQLINRQLRSIKSLLYRWQDCIIDTVQFEWFGVVFVLVNEKSPESCLEVVCAKPVQIKGCLQESRFEQLVIRQSGDQYTLQDVDDTFAIACNSIQITEHGLEDKRQKQIVRTLNFAKGLLQKWKNAQVKIAAISKDTLKLELVCLNIVGYTLEIDCSSKVAVRGFFEIENTNIIIFHNGERYIVESEDQRMSVSCLKVELREVVDV